MALRDRLRERARRLGRELNALYLACRDPRTPWYARAVAVLVVGYAFSPIDLIPDFIPVLGYLDDLILLPLGIWLALRLIPGDVLEAARLQAQEVAAEKRPASVAAAWVIVLVWLWALLGAFWLAWSHLGGA